MNASRLSLIAILLATTGCGITKVVTVPLGIAGTAVKVTGKAAETTMDAAQLAIPDGDKNNSEASDE